MNIEKYSIGIGDRFGKEGAAQIRALQKAEGRGVAIVPVWNKSHREHTLIGTRPDDVRTEADNAVRATGWKHAYYVDADHIGWKTVDPFLATADFFTLDVADFIGRPAPNDVVGAFTREMAPFLGKLRIPGLEQHFEVTEAVLEKVANQYLCAAGEAGRTYRHVAGAKGASNFVTEVSLDEAAEPQAPIELFFVLAALAREGIPLQTIAPKFTGKFLKGIDYVGDIEQFERDFVADLLVVEHAIRVFDLPEHLKISVHTGSDKFSLYPVIGRLLKKHGSGLHLKTAGTTWLEEVIGVALSGDSGLRIVKAVYGRALPRFDELCKPYETVVDIDRAGLPGESTVAGWTSQEFVERIRHDPSCARFSSDMRQLMHVAFKVAAEMGGEFGDAVDSAREIVGRCVTENLYERHIEPLLIGGGRDR